MMDTNQKRLLYRIRVYDFSIQETALYLNGHPCDQAAMAHYQKCRELRKNAVEEYEQAYGPLTIAGNTNENKWCWIDDPWAWELGDN